MSVLEARGVTVRAGDKTLLDEVALSLEAGKTVALVGPNGAGKSTLLRVLAGELRPHAGTVRLKGGNVFQLAQAHRADQPKTRHAPHSP
jgi:heme transport system ATP-binding protein